MLIVLHIFLITTLYNVCAVPWGVFSTVGDIMSTVGGYLEYRGVFSTVGDIKSIVGDVQYRGGFHDARGDIMSTVGGKSFVIWVPHGTEHPHGTHDIPHMHHDIPHGTQRMVSPYGTHDIPHMHHDIPHGTELPPRYSR